MMGRSVVTSGIAGRRHGLYGQRDRFRVFFLLCNSCYWRASQIGGLGIRKCPSCRNTVEPLPIATGELFRFNYDKKSGVQLYFRRA